MGDLKRFSVFVPSSLPPSHHANIMVSPSLLLGAFISNVWGHKLMLNILSKPNSRLFCGYLQRACSLILNLNV
ncbi:uncharacterized protein BDW43DRAFT_262938 [Aspergillus alliaceus]|uniref:uncharacterized protein n=1 Tax=Petromyces alliaceus TaxID=209559 RepID=UPI0012A45B74|nr:uncharacterized protein BDW43DRAFT_262938 [Aspergillus alliaceus]KAB8238049.1 hypothetical protein BDW43DRAFT_262938 [Aspergillus alliaceus]